MTIELKDSFTDILVKLSKGNPGAISVLTQMIKHTTTIDPDAAMGPLAHLLNLDSFSIYGPRIWMLYKDVCKQDLATMLAVLRAVQLGKLSRGTMNHAIDNYGEGMDIVSVIDIVKKELPNFVFKKV